MADQIASFFSSLFPGTEKPKPAPSRLISETRTLSGSSSSSSSPGAPSSASSRTARPTQQASSSSPPNPALRPTTVADEQQQQQQHENKTSRREVMEGTPQAPRSLVREARNAPAPNAANQEDVRALRSQFLDKQQGKGRQKSNKGRTFTTPRTDPSASASSSSQSRRTPGA